MRSIFAILVIAAVMVPTVASADVVNVGGVGPRDAAAVVWTGSHVVAFGGRHNSGWADQVIALDPATGQNVEAGRLVNQRLSAVWTGSAAYVFGGDCSLASCTTTYRWTQNGGVTETGAQLPNGVVGMQDAKAVWTGNFAFLFFGQIIRFDPVTNTYLKMNATTQGAHAAVWTGDYAIILSNDRVYHYYPEEDRLEESRVTWPTSVEFYSAAWDGKFVNVFGGQTAPCCKVRLIQQYSPETGNISVSPDQLEEDLSGTAAVWGATSGFVIGGTKNYPYYTGAVVEFTPRYPSAIRNLTVTIEGSNGETTLNWDSPARGPAPHFNVYRASPGAPFSLYVQVDTTSFKDFPGENVTYAYRVAASNGAGEGPFSTTGFVYMPWQHPATLTRLFEANHSLPAISVPPQGINPITAPGFALAELRTYDDPNGRYCIDVSSAGQSFDRLACVAGVPASAPRSTWSVLNEITTPGIGPGQLGDSSPVNFSITISYLSAPSAMGSISAAGDAVIVWTPASPETVNWWFEHGDQVPLIIRVDGGGNQREIRIPFAGQVLGAALRSASA